MLTRLQLMAQIMKLSYFPQIKVVHTSKIFYGQLYVPLINWLLMIGTVLAAAIYNNVSYPASDYCRTAHCTLRQHRLEMLTGMYT
jgi:K+ transporter